MFNRFNPFYSDDVDAGGSEGVSSESWGDALRAAAETATDDGQSHEDPDDSTEVDTDEEEVEGDPTDEAGNDGEEQPDEDPDIDMGEGRQAVKMSELKSGYLRQSDYTKKTQELATQRKEVEAQAEKLKPVGDRLEHMNNNPWLWGQINKAIEQFNQTEVFDIDEALADAHYGKYLNHLMAENKRLSGELERVNGEYEGVKLTGDMSKLRNELTAEYGDLVTDDYMQQLQDRAKEEKLSTSTLKEIADGHLAKQAMQASKTDVKKATKQADCA